MTPLLPFKNVASLTYQVNYLSVIFTQQWCQEDISALTRSLFQYVSAIILQEKVIGADRESIRFSCQQYAFVLNFDCYSQSCWIEGEDGTSAAQLKMLYREIKNHG